MDPHTSPPESHLLPRHVTAWLKGLAIIAVIANHYTMFYFHERASYSNSLVALFFLLGGAGVFLSLERDHARDGHGVMESASMLRYTFKRASRIYPLYWLAYGLFMAHLIYFDQLVGEFTWFNLVTAVIGAPTYPRGLFWFVPAILQCYLAAPILYRLIKKQGVKPALGSALMMGAALLALTYLVLNPLNDPMITDIVSYRRVLLGNVLVFFLGMLMPPLISLYGERLKKPGFLAASGIAFGLLIFLTDARDRVFVGSEMLLSPLLFAAAFAFCLSVIAARPRLPFGRLFRVAGDNAYALYLFHYPLFLFLFTVGYIQDYSYQRAALVLALMPLFGAVCFGLELLSRSGRSFVAAILFGSRS